MTQTKLEKARTYEKEQGAQIPPEERPLFHVTPAVGWANDPNGFSVYKGTYHLFHQYYPYDIHWGPMHWGHLTSTDLIRWEYLPAALAPDAAYDEQGVFSGSAVELPDGRQLLMYTGVYGREDVAECFQAQCIAVGNGRDYKKYEKNPVITADRIPEDCSPKDFRDPKIWRDEEEGCYYAVMGMRTADKSGAVVLFSSQDGFSWDYVTVLDRCRKEYGSMWECPDFFELGEDGMAVLIVSPQEMQAKGMEFHNGNDVVGFLGHYDRKHHRFTREHVFAVDYGLDFYAPQTLKTPGTDWLDAGMGKQPSVPERRKMAGHVHPAKRTHRQRWTADPAAGTGAIKLPPKSCHTQRHSSAAPDQTSRHIRPDSGYDCGSLAGRRRFF